MGWVVLTTILIGATVSIMGLVWMTPKERNDVSFGLLSAGSLMVIIGLMVWGGSAA